MMAQIEWYEEILALEPGSKVFFPFAKRLESEGLRGKALNVLRQGLAQHPEYLEARVLLAHLLQASGEAEAAAAEAGAVFARLCEYPEFWIAAGAAQLAQAVRPPASEDVALLLNMLAENARNPGQSFASLMRGACDPARLPKAVTLPAAPAPNAEDVMKRAVITAEKAAEEASVLMEEAALDAAVEIVEAVTASMEADTPPDLAGAEETSGSDVPQSCAGETAADCAQQADLLAETPEEPAEQEGPLPETVDGFPVTAAEVIIHAVEQELYTMPVDEVLDEGLPVSGNEDGEKLTGEQFSLLIAEKIIQASDRKEGHPDELLDLPDDLSAESEQGAGELNLADDALQALDADETEVGDADILDSPVDTDDMDELLASLPKPPAATLPDSLDEFLPDLPEEDNSAFPDDLGSEAELDATGLTEPQKMEPEAVEPEAVELETVALDEIVLDEIIPDEIEPEFKVRPASDLSGELADLTGALTDEPAEDMTTESTDEPDDEPVRTRSMAEVLAEQGDIEGALAIYSELLHSAQPEEAEVITQRMTVLSGEQQSDNARQAAPANTKGEKTDKAARTDNAGLRKMLENLAGRLEKRARS